MTTSQTIPQNINNNAFFAGCEIVYDDTLPENCVALVSDGYMIVWDATTGEIIEMREYK